MMDKRYILFRNELDAIMKTTNTEIKKWQKLQKFD